VPAAIVIVDEFPLTDNGKVDFNALPAPQRRTAQYVAPRTPLEEELIEMWEALLGVPRIGVHDDFFALGGHSLLLARLGTEIQEAFGAEVPLRELFEAATVERMTEAILASQLAEVDADEAARLLAEVGQEERP
jgi:acyl carrier protein